MQKIFILGLIPPFDNVNALTFGFDGIYPEPINYAMLVFSVDTASFGAFGTAVDFEVSIGSDYGVPDIPAPPEHTADIFFSIDTGSFSVGLPAPDFRPGPIDGITTSDDILSTQPPGGSYGIFASGVFDIGLLPGDDIDALCLTDIELHGFLDPGWDFALFSLALYSPSLTVIGGWCSICCQSPVG